MLLFFFFFFFFGSANDGIFMENLYGFENKTKLSKVFIF